MKMLVNGGLNCSTLDGWWDEAYAPGGRLGDRRRTREHRGEHDADDACELYALLEHEIAPEFYDRDAARRAAGLDRPRAAQHDPPDRAVLQRSDGAGVCGAGLLAGRAGLSAAARLRGTALAGDWKTGRRGSMTSGKACASAASSCSRTSDQWQFEVQATWGA